MSSWSRYRFGPVLTRDGGEVIYEGQAQLHRTEGPDDDPQNVAARVIVWEDEQEQVATSYELGRPANRQFLLEGSEWRRPVVRISPDLFRDPRREKDMRFPFLVPNGCGGLTWDRDSGRAKDEWTVLLPVDEFGQGPGPVRITAALVGNRLTMSPTYEGWEADLIIHELATPDHVINLGGL